MAKILAPIVVDLGKASGNKLEELLHGTGPLMEDAQTAIEQVRAGLGQGMEGKRLLPIVVVYKKKRTRRPSMFRIPTSPQ